MQVSACLGVRSEGGFINIQIKKYICVRRFARRSRSGCFCGETPSAPAREIITSTRKRQDEEMQADAAIGALEMFSSVA